MLKSFPNKMLVENIGQGGVIGTYYIIILLGLSILIHISYGLQGFMELVWVSQASSSSDPCLGSCSPQVSCEHQGKAGLGAPRHADSSF